MKFHLLASAALALTTPVVESFSPGDFLVKAIREETEVEILPGVGLPTDTDNMPALSRVTNFFQLSKKTNKDVVSWVADGDVNELFGKLPGLKKEMGKNLSIQPKRSELFRSIFAIATNEVIKVDKNDPDPAEGYLYFGNRNYKKILPMLCQVNPFFASALTVSEDGEHLELVSYADHPEYVKEPLYLSLMREMIDDSHRINAKFDLDMNLVGMTKLNEAGESVEISEDEWDYYCSGILYNMLYYSSAVHANIHILHYLMCTCIIMATRDTNRSMEKWADIFDDNIAIKHIEVAAVLFESKLAGKSFEPKLKADAKLISGPNGFGADLPVMDKILKMQELWGTLKNTDDFMKKFLLEGIYSTAASEEKAEEIMKQADILTEFKKHSANVPLYAKEITEAMKKDDEPAVVECEKNIAAFMKACGNDVSSIDSISSWSQLMCNTGIVHGSTLSYTRLMITPEVARWRNIHSDTWDEYDQSLMNIGFGTCQGMTLDRHVFTGAIEHGFKWETDDISEGLMEVLEKYDQKAEALKTEYTKQIQTRDDFAEYGWILTDHCNDGYDGKQHTITTYI